MQNLDRSKYKVLVESRKQAKQFKQALLAVGEEIDENYWLDVLNICDQEHLLFDTNNWLCAEDTSGERELISFKDLLKMIVTGSVSAKNAHTSLLDGKVAVQAANKKEWILLKAHIHNKGWRSKMGFNVIDAFSFYSHGHGQKNILTYHDKVIRLDLEDSDRFNPKNTGHKVIPFSEFAAEVGIEVPVFVMRSQDGVDLYAGDESFVPQSGVGKYTHVRSFPVRIESKQDLSHRFSTKEAAEKWIAEQNKPTHVNLQFPNSTATVSKGLIQVFFNRGIVLRITEEQLNKIVTAHQSLQPF